MTEQRGEALELALLLARTPALRGALRSRPLPAGVGEVLAIASGSSEGVGRAAARTGHNAAELVEAARFYVQQVLLAEGANAYRVLGAERDADRATLRDHHRLLLRWLHPDRSQADAQWDSALSTRVNQAWNHLRTDAARAAYDAALAPDPTPAAGSMASSPGAAIAAIPIAAMPASEETRFAAAPMLVGLLGVICIVLAWFAVNRDSTFPESAGASPPAASRARAFHDAGRASPLSGLQQGAAAIVANAAAPPATPAQEAVPPVVAAPSPEDAPRPAASPAAAPLAAVMPVTPVTSVVAAEDLAPQPSSATAPASASASASAPTPAPAPAVALAPPPAFAPAPAPLPLAPPETIAPGHETAAVAARPARDVTDPLQLFHEAEAAVRDITAYLVAREGPEPAWLDLPTGLEAAGIRSQLQARHQGRARPRMELESPNWTLGSQAASALGAYRLGDRRDIVETGVLRVELVRLDSQWRVVGLQLEPAR